MADVVEAHQSRRSISTPLHDRQPAVELVEPEPSPVRRVQRVPDGPADTKLCVTTNSCRSTSPTRPQCSTVARTRTPPGSRSGSGTASRNSAYRCGVLCSARPGAGTGVRSAAYGHACTGVPGRKAAISSAVCVARAAAEWWTASNGTARSRSPSRRACRRPSSDRPASGPVSSLLCSPCRTRYTSVRAIRSSSRATGSGRASVGVEGKAPVKEVPATGPAALSTSSPPRLSSGLGPAAGHRCRRRR
jgi:hypothetical protein